jgi:GDSL-like Lipase/Acylhydrolase family
MNIVGQNWKMKLAESASGRALLHLVCLCRGSRRDFHWNAIRRECRSLANPPMRRQVHITVLLAMFVLTGNRLVAAPGVEPSNAAELATKKTQPSYDLVADAKRKAVMPSDEAAWESVLEQNLGNFYLPIYKKEKLAGKETAWDFVKDDPKLPRVLLIGDSISRGYTLVVRHALAGKANVHRAPANCGPTAMALTKLPVWLGDGKWDVIYFNFGIHDRLTDDATYAANLENIIAQLEKTSAKLIWARTTPPASGENKEKFTAEQCEKVNRIADAIMRKHGIPEDDLYAAVAPRLAELQNKNDVHFNNKGYEVLGGHVAEAILEALRPKINIGDKRTETELGK